MSQVDMSSKFPSMTPIKSPPTLHRINGCGFGMYGRRDYDAQTCTYVSTLCLTLIFVPLFCLKAYRVAQAAGGGWYFYGREPLSKAARLWNMLLVLGIAIASIKISRR